MRTVCVICHSRLFEDEPGTCCQDCAVLTRRIGQIHGGKGPLLPRQERAGHEQRIREHCVRVEEESQCKS